MKSEILFDDSYASIVGRAEGIMEMLERDHIIIAVSITSRGGGHAYAAAIFFKPKAD